MHLALDFDRRARASLDFEVEEVLQIEPELGIGVEVARQAQGCVGGDAAALMHNFADAGRRHVQVERQPVDREGERLHEILAQDLARMDRRHQSLRLAHGKFSSVVIHNLHFVGMTLAPDEADPPPVVDANRMLSHPGAP